MASNLKFAGNANAYSGLPGCLEYEVKSNDIKSYHIIWYERFTPPAANAATKASDFERVASLCWSSRLAEPDTVLCHFCALPLWRVAAAGGIFRRARLCSPA